VLHPGKEKPRYFFFAFLAFFAFFFAAFFAFLAIISSQGLMVRRDTRDARRRASLATSSTATQQIRAALPRAVTSASSRYPQLLRVFG
jgi:hypothetical protein